MFNCVYSDGSVISTEDIGKCVGVNPFTGAELIDITDLSTTVEVTTAAPGELGPMEPGSLFGPGLQQIPIGWIALGLVGLVLLAGKPRKQNARMRV